MGEWNKARWLPIIWTKRHRRCDANDQQPLNHRASASIHAAAADVSLLFYWCVKCIKSLFLFWVLLLHMLAPGPVSISSIVSFYDSLELIYIQSAAIFSTILMFHADLCTTVNLYTYYILHIFRADGDFRGPQLYAQTHTNTQTRRKAGRVRIVRRLDKSVLAVVDGFSIGEAAMFSISSSRLDW